jgi:hypothetical protein
VNLGGRWARRAVLGIALWQALPRVFPLVALSSAPIDTVIVLAVLGTASLFTSPLPFWQPSAIDPAEAFLP